MPERGYIELTTEELAVEAEVTNELLDALETQIQEAAAVIGSARTERILLDHVLSETERRLEEKARERRRASIR